MSTKSSALMNSASTSVLIAVQEAFRKAALTEAAEPYGPQPGPPPTPEEDIQESEYGEYVPASLHLMAKMFQAIINSRYAKYPGSIAAMPTEEDDGSVSIMFHPVDPEPDEKGNFSIYNDPDFYDAMRALLDDLDQFTIGTTANAYVPAATIAAADKLDLYKVLSAYTCSEEFAMTTPDTIYVSEKHFDPEIADQQRRYTRDLHAAKARGAMENPDNAEAIFALVANTPFSSIRDFEAACYACSFADLPIPLDHILRTIGQEDGFTVSERPELLTGMKLSYGGYN